MSSSHHFTRTGSNALSAGLTLAVSVGLFTYVGLWLDRRFGTAPWCLLACVVLGFAGGLLHVIRVLAPELWPFGKLPEKPASRGGRPEERPRP